MGEFILRKNETMVPSFPLGKYYTKAESDARYVLNIPGQAQDSTLKAWTYGQLFALISGTRDVNEALTSGSIVWPDGSTGTFTADVLSTAFPGAIDAYHVTYVNGGTTKTITQGLLTRDAAGAVVAQPALTIS